MDAADERAHPPGDDPLWNESWYFDFASLDGSLGGYVRLGLYPNLGVAWYWACLVGEGRPLVTVIDHDVPLPRAGTGEVRTEGLWADHTCEEPYEHWTLGCEAFAVAVDDPADVYGRLLGDRVPFGLDLEWETGGGVYPYPGTTRYEVPCRVHGEILVGDEQLTFDGTGQRDHSWGVRDWWTFGWCWTAGRLDDGTRFHAARIRIPGMEGYAPGYVGRPGALEQIDALTAEEDLGPEGLPAEGRARLGPLELTIRPVAFAPVLLVAPDGRESRFPRALCRFESGDGRTGVGWTEWNQPEATAP